MKRMLVILVIAVLAVYVFVGCADDNDSKPKISDETTQSETLSTTEKTESATTALKTTTTTKIKSTQSTPIPTQAPIKTVSQIPVTTQTTTSTTTQETTTTPYTTEVTSDSGTTEFTMTEGVYSVTINGNRVALGTSITDKIQKLGNPVATVSHDGDFSIYSYDGCKITARSGYVIQITVTGSQISTESGIKIGSSKKDVVENYPGGNSSENYVYVTNGQSAVRFNLTDEKVSLITISVS